MISPTPLTGDQSTRRPFHIHDDACSFDVDRSGFKDRTFALVPELFKMCHVSRESRSVGLELFMAPNSGALFANRPDGLPATSRSVTRWIRAHLHKCRGGKNTASALTLMFIYLCCGRRFVRYCTDKSDSLIAVKLNVFGVVDEQ